MASTQTNTATATSNMNAAEHEETQLSTSRDVHGAIHFLDPENMPEPDEILLKFVYTPHLWSPDAMKFNYYTRLMPKLPIRDIRPRKDEVSLDREGFMIYNTKCDLAYADCHDEEKLKADLAPILREELTQMLGAKLIYFNECVIRKVKAGSGKWAEPIPIAHVDSTLDDITLNIIKLAGDNAPNLLQRRYQALNVWKPLRGPVRDNCLALCDAQTFDVKKHGRTACNVFREGSQQNYRILHSPEQQWYYLSDQQASEVLVFKIADSQATNVVPHASFTNPQYPNEVLGRESIEFRAIVIY